MRGKPFSRLVAARAILAGVLISGGAWHPAFCRADQAPNPTETALAQPRVKLPAGNSALGLPQPLPPDEAARVRRILGLQRGGQFDAAEAETARLTDETLLGDIMADRLLREAHPPAAALRDWLERYSDLPDAPAVVARLDRALPAGAPHARIPSLALLGSPDSALPPEGGGAARAAFVEGRDQAAYRLGLAGWRRSRHQDGEAAYVAALAAWRAARFADAGALFAAAARAPGADSGLRAAGAFWAARVALRRGDLSGWQSWTGRAAAEPRTLHGQIARRALGIADMSAPGRLLPGDADLEAVLGMPGGRRFFALLQVGETARADTALRMMWPAVPTGSGAARSLLLVARVVSLPRVAGDMAAALGWDDIPPRLPRLRPAGGFTLSPALVYAVARVESNFDPAAGSGSGARGLMQLRGDAVAALRAPGRADLRDPGTNLRLGQRYLAYLSAQSPGDDLLRVLAAYNAGPGALAHWDVATDDPLLFIETLPRDETRRYVTATLSYLWGYARRMGLQSPSLAALAAGVWPRFSAELARLR